jgi:hypothetical protein
MSGVNPTWHGAGGMYRPGGFATSGLDHNTGTMSGKRESVGGWQNPISVGNAPTDKQVADVKSLMAFFGEPSRDRVNNMTRWKAYEKENSDYPEAFRQMYGDPSGSGRFNDNGHVSNVILEKTLASQCWQLSIMAPWVLWEKSIDFTWNVDYYTKHMLDRSPEESLPRLLSMTRTNGAASMVRYGIAFLLEATFMETPQGRFSYMMNIEQIKVATIETASYGAMVSVLEHVPWDLSRGLDESEGKQYSISELNGIFRAECDSFGIVHKSLAGAEIAINKLHMELANRTGSVSGNFTVIPAGMAQYVKESKMANRAFYMTGPGSGGDSDIARAMSEASTVVESRNFSRGSHSQGHDPFFKPTTIGNYISMDDAGCEYRSFDPKDPMCYRTSHLDTWSYGGEDLDRFVLFRYAEMFRYSGLWNFGVPQAPLTDSIGRGAMYDMGCYTWGQLLHKDGRMQLAVNALAAMPEEKRLAFKQSLRLIQNPQGGSDPRTFFKDGAKYPGQFESTDAFEPDLFDGMLDENGGIQWDESFTVPEFNEYARRNAIGFRDMTTKSSKAKAADNRFGAAKRSRQQFTDEDEHKSLSLQYQEGRHDSDMDDSSDDDYHDDDTAVYHKSGSHIAKTVVKRTTYRAKRNGYPSKGMGGQTTEASRLQLQIIKLHEECSKQAANDKENLRRSNECKAVLNDYTQLILYELPGKPSDDLKISLLRELLRVAESEIRRVHASQGVGAKFVEANQLLSLIHAGLTPTLAELQTRLVLNDIPVNLSLAFENTKRVDATSDLSDISNDQARQGWWYSKPFTQTELTKKEDADREEAAANVKRAAYDAEVTRLSGLLSTALNASPVDPDDVSNARDELDDYKRVEWPAVEKLLLAAEKAKFAYEKVRLARVENAVERGVESGNIRLVALPNARSWAETVRLPHDVYASTLTAKHTVLFHLDDDQMTCLKQTEGMPTFARSLPSDRMDAYCWSIAASQLYTAIRTEVDAKRKTAGFDALDPDEKDVFTTGYIAAHGADLDAAIDDIQKSWSEEFRKRIIRFAATFDAAKIKAMDATAFRGVLPTQSLLTDLIRLIEFCLVQYVSSTILITILAADKRVALVVDGVYDPKNTAFSDPNGARSVLHASLANGYKSTPKGHVVSKSKADEDRRRLVLIAAGIPSGHLTWTAPTWVITPGEAHSVALGMCADTLRDVMFDPAGIRPSDYADSFVALRPSVVRIIEATSGGAADPKAVAAVAVLDDVFQKLAVFCARRYRDDKALRKKEKQKPAEIGDVEGAPNTDWTLQGIEDLLMQASLASGEFMQFCIDNNIPVPLALKLWRPNGTYTMAQILHMQAGLDGAAQTYYQRPHFMMADNAGQKMIFGHYTIYTKTIVKQPEKIVMARNVYCRSYDGGNDATVWDPLDPHHLKAFASKKLECSIFVTAGFMSKAVNNRSTFLSFTGEMPSTIPCTADVANHVRYEGCSAVAKHWGYKTNGRDYRMNQPYRSEANMNERQYNVICMQYYQSQWSDTTRSFSRTTLNAGHWGKDAPCPGNAAVIRGTRLVFDPAEYGETRVSRLV